MMMATPTMTMDAPVLAPRKPDGNVRILLTSPPDVGPSVETVKMMGRNVMMVTKLTLMDVIMAVLSMQGMSVGKNSPASATGHVEMGFYKVVKHVMIITYSLEMGAIVYAKNSSDGNVILLWDQQPNVGRSVVMSYVSARRSVTMVLPLNEMDVPPTARRSLDGNVRAQLVRNLHANSTMISVAMGYMNMK